MIKVIMYSRNSDIDTLIQSCRGDTLAGGNRSPDLFLIVLTFPVE